MTQNVNPNSRSPFVDSGGHLSKYGMDVIAVLYRALDVAGDGSTAIDGLDATGSEIQQARMSAELSDLRRSLESLAAGAQDHTVQARLSSLSKRLSALEANQPEQIPWKQIIKRLDAIEAQL